MTTLSNKDISRELGKNILIHPFNEQNLKGASYNLTASKLAWRIEDGKTAYDDSENKIIIPPGSTVLIETNETIWVAKNICGTYHSKVYWVSKGMGHIGTTLDPDYIGPSLIAVHNHSKTSIKLTPEKDETFVSLMLHYVKTTSSIPHLNKAGRPDILKQVQVSQDEDSWLDEPFRNDRERLRAELKKSEAFKKFKGNGYENIIYFFPYIILGIIFSLSLVTYLYLDASRLVLSQKDWYNTVITITDRTMYSAFAALIVQITTDIRRG